MPMIPRRSVRIRAALALLTLVASPAAFSQSGAAAPDDPLEGRWLGTIGSDKERIEAGIELRRDPATGKLQLRLTQPVSNYFDVDPGGELKRDGNRITHDALMLTLSLQGDRLEGHFPGPRSPASLRRVAELPVAQPPPDVPRGPPPRWQVRLGGQVYATPAIADGIAFVGTTGGVFNAVDTRDGRIAWATGIGQAMFGEALVTADAVYVVSDGGLLHKLARADGKLAWEYRLDDGRTARVLPHPAVFDWDWQAPRPVLADGVLYVGGADGSFHAVDAGSGQPRWQVATGGRIRNGAAANGPDILVPSGRKLLALSRADGRPRWEFEAMAEIDAIPVVAGDRVLVGDRGAGLYSIDAGTGALDWRLYFWGSWVESTPVLVGGTLYIGSSDLRRVSAIEPGTGKVLWRSDVHGWTWGTPLVLGDRIYVGAAGGTPYFLPHQASFSVLDRASGRILRRWPLPDTGGHQWGIAGSPVAAGDLVVVASIEGSLYGFPAAE